MPEGGPPARHRPRGLPCSNASGVSRRRAVYSVYPHRIEAKRMTEVVAALILEGGRFMICQRPAHKARGLLWEFVGGKVEPGESKEQALVRECREELGICIEK